MTTLKEYKSMMEGATDAPWGMSCANDISWAYIAKKGDMICDHFGGFERDEDAVFVIASRNIAPELIRVIELAEVALEVSLSMSENECWPVEEIIIRQALSEIRKLKGE